ncbi:MAG: BolA family protein [Deltaproteobacteria bacterium]|nr:BolA family protein [Deltaproteobacteria bacterium]
MGTIEETITKKIWEAFHPLHWELENESAKHKGHGAFESLETHFKLLIVSASFEGKTLMERHRMVYSLLAQELKEEIHALALKTCTPPEWEKQNKK